MENEIHLHSKIFLVLVTDQDMLKYNQGKILVTDQDMLKYIVKAKF